MNIASRYTHEFQQWAPDHHQGLSNHLPMAVLALIRIGADEPNISAFITRYSRQLDALQVPVESSLSSDQMISLLGSGQMFSEVRNTFSQLIAKQGLTTVLATWLPTLCTGLSSRAFHPLIRLGYD